MVEAKYAVNQFIKLDLEELLRLRVEEIKQQQAIISFEAGREAARKEVGEWLAQRCDIESGDGWKRLGPAYIGWNELESLKQGKLPEEEEK